MGAVATVGNPVPGEVVSGILRALVRKLGGHVSISRADLDMCLGSEVLAVDSDGHAGLALTLEKRKDKRTAKPKPTKKPKY